MPYAVKHYGWLRDLPDQRDHLYAAPAETLAALPPAMDLRSHCPPIYDQGQLVLLSQKAAAWSRAEVVF
jgi:hypothetical protein